MLFDYYGELLTEKQRRVFEARYRYDLSLGEIDEAEGVTRQAAHDMLSRTERILENFDSKMKLLEEAGSGGV